MIVLTYATSWKLLVKTYKLFSLTKVRTYIIETILVISNLDLNERPNKFATNKDVIFMSPK
jgi:hypothetical protein